MHGASRRVPQGKTVAPRSRGARKPIRALGDLTRYRQGLVGQYTQQVNRLHKTLESANIKWSSVASNIVGVRGQGRLRALQAGEDDATRLAELATGALRGKIPQLRLALDGRVLPYHRFLIGQVLDYLDRAIARLDGAIASELDPYAAEVPWRQWLDRDRRDSGRNGDRHAPVCVRASLGLLGGGRSREQAKGRETLK